MLHTIKLVISVIEDSRTRDAFKAFLERSKAISSSYRTEVRKAYRQFLAKKEELKTEYNNYHSDNQQVFENALQEVFTEKEAELSSAEYEKEQASVNA